MSRPRRPRSSRGADPARLVAFDALREVHSEDAYANLVLSRLLRERRLSARDAAFATELFAGTCRLQGSYDVIIEAASGRKTNSLQPAVLDLLRLGSHQLLSMRVADHAAVAATVDLAADTVGRRVTGLVNAVLRKVGARSYDDWINQLSQGMGERDELALRTAHPRWIVDAYADLLPEAEVADALAANNVQPVTSLVVRPGLAAVQELITAGATPGRWSPYAASWTGDPADLPAVAEGRAGVQDEGSQLVALALARAVHGEPPPPHPEPVEGPPAAHSEPPPPHPDVDGLWLDLCAGPGGKSALLAGLARQHGARLIASEPALHRARLVRNALRGYDHQDQLDGRPRPDVQGRGLVIAADGTRPAWRAETFAAVLADVACTGLGALRRRPESRWRRTADAVQELHDLQRRLLDSALRAARPGGVVAYVTCSPHRHETADVVESVLAGREDLELLDAPAMLPEVPDTRLGSYVQLWPHRHGTDAMFLALIRRSG